MEKSNLLIDSQILIWSQYQPEKLSERAKILLQDDVLTKWISIVTIWELTIKISKNALAFDFDWKQLFEEQPFELMKIDVSHIDQTRTLPFIHKDPFDRLLIAQSIVEEMPLITSDKHIHQYDFAFIKA